jgi:RimJ/RimL family protein N-acetyltransferase
VVVLANLHRTDRLTLRPVAASDEAAVVAGIDNISVAGWLAVVPHPYTAADFQHFLNDIAVSGETFLIEDGVGFAGMISVVDGELGYWLAPRAQGLGYATEAGRCLVAAHFGSSAAPLTSGHFEGNKQSANVLAKLGFVETSRDLKRCVARGADLPHVNVTLTREAFV